MSTVAVTLRREPAAAVLVGAVGLLAVAVVTGFHPAAVAPLVLFTTVLTALHRSLLRWTSLLGAILVVVLLVPIKRYELPGNLPFDFELYRLLVALVLLCWFSSLLIDLTVQLRRSAFDAPLLLLVIAVVGSDLTNPSRVQSLSAYVGKSLTFFLAFILLYYFVVSVVREREAIRSLARVLVAGGAVVAVFAIIERRTGYNVFDQLQTVFPPLQFEGGGELSRAGRLRVYGSAQHPIALGAMFAMLIPLAVYLAQTGPRLRWWLSGALLSLGVLATASRTAIVMLVVAYIVFMWLKPVETRRLWPVLVPGIVIVHLFLPGSLGTIRQAFFPANGLLSEQTVLAPGSDPQLAGGRIRQLGPSLEEAGRKPILGQGYGTRITGFDSKFRNAPILDNQWLGSLLELGAVGFGALIWLLIRTTRRLGRAAKRTRDGDDWMFTAFAASVAAFGVGMLTYDAFSFVQVTFLFWILLALGATALAIADDRQQAVQLAS